MMEPSNSPPFNNSAHRPSPQLPQFTQSTRTYSARAARAPTKTVSPQEMAANQPSSQPPTRRSSRPRPPGGPTNVRYLLAGSSILAGLVLMVDVSRLFEPERSQDICQEVVQAESVLSRNELLQLLSIPERSARSAVRSVVSAPYCLMPHVEVRAGVMAEREAYPLAFDPETWVVILYEGEEYAGYAFSFHQ
ncbi:MAG: hypothetical protein VKK04_05780 [Synechococcales bacterium]|nr:hypothetical protein [Synechococcales bacterium]